MKFFKALQLFPFSTRWCFCKHQALWCNCSTWTISCATVANIFYMAGMPEMEARSGFLCMNMHLDSNQSYESDQLEAESNSFFWRKEGIRWSRDPGQMYIGEW